MKNDLTNERWVSHRVHPEWQDGTRVRYVDSVSNREICTVYGGDDDASVVTSRARLIAAAPIGYDLAVEVMRLCNVGVTVPESVAKLAADFISKATGK